MAALQVRLDNARRAADRAEQLLEDLKKEMQGNAREEWGTAEGVFDHLNEKLEGIIEEFEQSKD